MLEKIKRFVTPVAGMKAAQAKDFMAGNEEGSYTLLDVRQPGEYTHSHIPGSTLVPLPELTSSLDKIDPEKPVIVY
jgi:sulfur-carrier protein adenylyltransferase/sulfurtransferase